MMEYDFEPVEEQKYRGYTIKYFNEEYIEDPRKEWDSLGTMVCEHKRYDFGDEDFGNATSHAGNWDDAFALYIADKYRLFDYSEDKHESLLGKAYKYIEKNIVYLPVYMYDHSGITINTTGFLSKWDSGQIGFIYAHKNTIRKEYGIKHVTQKYIDRTKEVLNGEIEVYDAYISGNVLYYCVEDANGSLVDSLHGFYIVNQNYKYIEEEAKYAVDADIEYKFKKRLKKLKTLISAKAPLEVRQQILLSY